LGDLFGNREIFQRAARYWQENEPNHQDDILSIVKALLANGIESTICRHIREKDMIKENSITSGREFDVKVFDIPNIGSFTEWELSDKLGHNFAILQHNPKLINCFDEHLKTGYPQVIDKRIQEAIYKKPYELIEILRNITSQRYIKGNCQVCKGPNNISF
jgi:hypothetical protein